MKNFSIFNMLLLFLLALPAAHAGQGQIIQQNTATTPITFTLVSVVDGSTAVTGATPTVKLSKVSGGVLTTAASPVGAVTAIDATNQPGAYQIAGNATDTNTLGPVHVTVTATGAIQRDFDIFIVGYNPLVADIGSILSTGFITIPASHSSNGSSFTLNIRQAEALNASLLGGDASQTVPVASSTATVTYYLIGATHITANVVAVSSPTYDASKNMTGRTLIITNPFPVN